MLDWKKRQDSAPERAAEPKSATRGYFRGMLFSRALATLLGLYLLTTILIGWYWSQEPPLFPVQQNAQLAAEKEGRKMVVGYTTVETLKTVAGTLLHKPGGYLSNDRFPPGLWLDNIPSWEYGVLVQVRDMTRAMRKDFALPSRNRLKMPIWPRPSRASTSTTRAGCCRPASRNIRK